jgi:hypothetical protein
MTDVFDYPTVAPNSFVALNYNFFSPGGPGNSTGLMEYIIPLSLTPGSIESGSVVLQFQLFDSDPDTNPAAMPVGGLDSSTPVSYQVQAVLTSVPEPSCAVMLIVSLGLMFWRLSTKDVHRISNFRENRPMN